MTVSSGLTVNTAQQTGLKHGVGNLATGFALTLDGAQQNMRFIMGSQLHVAIEWLAHGMPELDFKAGVGIWLGFFCFFFRSKRKIPGFLLGFGSKILDSGFLIGFWVRPWVLEPN